MEGKSGPAVIGAQPTASTACIGGTPTPDEGRIFGEAGGRGIEITTIRSLYSPAHELKQVAVADSSAIAGSIPQRA
jgi:hypothetical protein